MKVYGIIPSRFGSSRFPGKPLADLAGKPLVAWVVEAVSKAASLDGVYVATDDERIVKAVEAHGGKAVMTPSELPSGTDRIACAARAVAGGDFGDDDILVNIQGDEPLIDPALIDALAMKLKTDSKWDMATAVTPIRTREDLAAKSVVKVVLDRDDGALYFSRLPIPANRDAEADISSGLYVRHLGIYAYRGAFLKRYVAESPCELEKTEKLEQLRALWMGAKIAVVRTDDEGIGVDTPEDAVRVGAMLAARRVAMSVLAAFAIFFCGCRRTDVRDFEIDVPQLSQNNTNIVAKSLAGREGVFMDSLKFDLAAKKVHLRYDSMALAKKNIEFAIAEAGLEANGVKPESVGK